MAGRTSGGKIPTYHIFMRISAVATGKNRKRKEKDVVPVQPSGNPISSDMEPHGGPNATIPLQAQNIVEHSTGFRLAALS